MGVDETTDDEVVATATQRPGWIRDKRARTFSGLSMRYTREVGKEKRDDTLESFMPAAQYRQGPIPYFNI